MAKLDDSWNRGSSAEAGKYRAVGRGGMPSPRASRGGRSLMVLLMAVGVVGIAGGLIQADNDVGPAPDLDKVVVT